MLNQNKRGSSLCDNSFLHENHVYFDEYGLLSTISYQFKKPQYERISHEISLF